MQVDSGGFTLVDIRDNVIENALFGIDVQSTAFTTVDHNLVEESTAGVVFRLPETAATDAFVGANILHNSVSGLSAFGIIINLAEEEDLSHSFSADFEGNTADDNGDVGIRVQASSFRTDFVDNAANENGTDGILIHRGTVNNLFRMFDNEVSGNGGFGVNLASVSTPEFVDPLYLQLGFRAGIEIVSNTMGGNSLEGFAADITTNTMVMPRFRNGHSLEFARCQQSIRRSRAHGQP